MIPLRLSEDEKKISDNIVLNIFKYLDGDNVQDMVSDLACDKCDPFPDGAEDELYKEEDRIWEQVVTDALLRVWEMTLRGQRLGVDGVVRTLSGAGSDWGK